MTEKQIINELDSIIFYCDTVKTKATGLRRKLERLNAPASRKRAGKLSEEDIARVLEGREKFRNKKRREIEQEIEKENARKQYNAERRAIYHLNKKALAAN